MWIEPNSAFVNLMSYIIILRLSKYNNNHTPKNAIMAAV